MAWLQPMATIPNNNKKINIVIYFENLTVELHVIYIFLIHMSNFMSIRFIYCSIYKLIFYI